MQRLLKRFVEVPITRIVSRSFVAILMTVALAPIARSLAARAPTIADDHGVPEMMVKNALAALNHANLTGNYTVLRDLSGERFRRRNSAADLAKTFAAHREERYDLSPILCAVPQFTRPPAEAASGRLELVGYFNTRPENVTFAIAYERSDGGWALDEISVGMTPADNGTIAPSEASH